MENNSLPLISVLMGVHALDEYYSKAIRSISEQTYPNLELIIIANGVDSTNIASQLRREFDAILRIPLIIVETPIAQLSNALNLGLNIAKGTFIARMDADDISEPSRIAEQYHFLCSNELEMVGTQLSRIDERDSIIGEQLYPTSTIMINLLLPFRNTFAHNSVLFEKALLIKHRGYIGGFNTEDYDLWLRMRRVGVRWRNMKQKLVRYRIHTNTSQRSRLSYAEVCGLIFRELMLTGNILYLLALPTHFIRLIVKSR